MIEIVYYAASSLDGYIATKDGGVGWLSPFQKVGENHGYREFYDSVDAILMGSRTYEFALSLGKWPTPDKPIWVFTRRKLAVAHPSVTLTAQSPCDTVEDLQSRRFRRAWLMGGGELAASFRDRGLISHYVISVIPVILGSGIPLFAAGGEQSPLKLVKTREFPGGIVQICYEKGHEAEKGSA